MSSPALADLAGRLDEVRVLAATDPVRSGDTSNRSLTGAVNRACLVLLSAHLEGFLEDVAVEALDRLVTHGAIVDQLPLLLRAIHTEEHLRQLEFVRDRNARAPRIRRLFANEAGLWQAGTVLQATMIRHKTVCGEMANPGSRELSQFLELIGVDIRQHLDIQGKAFLLGKVDGLVARRNAIAHGETATSVTFRDVDDYVGVVEDLASEVDSAVAAAVQAICALPARPW